MEDWGEIRLYDPETGNSARIEAAYGPPELADGCSVSYRSSSRHWRSTSDGLQDLTVIRGVDRHPIRVLGLADLLEDAVGNWRAGRAPRVGLADLLAVRRILDQAYAGAEECRS